jgi:hypothetical protein
MKKERQIGVRVGLPAFFALEVEDVYRHTSGAHRALAFLDFLGLLIGLGLETYRKQYRQEEAPGIEEEPPEEPGTPDGEALNLFDMTPKGLKDMFRDFDEAIGSPPRTGLHLVRMTPEETGA